MAGNDGTSYSIHWVKRKEKEQLYTKQFAATIAKLTGEEFSPAIANGLCF